MSYHTWPSLSLFSICIQAHGVFKNKVAKHYIDSIKKKVLVRRDYFKVGQDGQ